MGQWSVGAAVSLWRTRSDTVSQRRVAMEVAGLAVWGAAQRRTKLTDEQVPLELDAIGPDTLPSAQMKAYTRWIEVYRVDAVYGVDTGGHRWTVVDGVDFGYGSFMGFTVYSFGFYCYLCLP